MLQKLAHLVRAVLLAVSLLAAATAWIFVARPHWVHALDARMVAAHTADAEAVLARAQSAAATPEQVVAELEPLLVRLRGVRKGDRLAPAKRTALALLARAQRDRGETAAVLATAAAWQEFDALDLDAKLMAQAALAALPGRGQEAAAGARALFELAPGSERFLLPHLRACLAARDEAAVAQAFFAHLAAGGTPASDDITRGFTLLRDDGDGFDPLRTEDIAVHCEDGTLAVTFAPALGARRMRLRFPPRAALRLHDARLRIAAAGSTAELPLRDLARLSGGAVGLHGMRLDGAALVLDGDDEPALLWELGPGAGLATTWTLLGRVEQATRPWLAEVLALAAVGAAGRDLLASAAVEDTRARLRYRAARRALLLHEGVTVQAGADAPVAVAVAAEGDEHVAFRAVVARGSHGALRISLPALAGIELNLHAPFPVAARLQPGSTVQAEDSVLRAAAAPAVLVLALQPGDPDRIELSGRLR